LERSEWKTRQKELELNLESVLSDLHAARKAEKRSLMEREEFAHLLRLERKENERLKVGEAEGQTRKYFPSVYRF
jgi:hypothetical protein